jgi:hypothetical protein
MNTIDYIKANRKGSREAQLESENGWVAIRKVHKSKKTYTRKTKHKAY